MTSLYRNEPQPTRGRDRRIQIVRVLLEAEFHRKLPLSEMGKAVSLSPWRLAHLFKSETGMSPQRYLTLVRLQRAKDRLENGFLPIREVGASVGMPNPSQFTKTFKAAYGMSPIQYRRSYLRIETPRREMDSVSPPFTVNLAGPAIET
jgi:AraC family transcriptional regulator of arabinose operon